ncbi:3-oxoacyl-[acyl-carrier-protein] synthase III C-terminal domain-containing protein [Paenibacillus sp.]|uniref:type III polyketide synthase n=1 Tax=Paenibacillus sp. TaxID=58172 RepID=UPI002810D418|nr:3-oxoacyl-[acyl-carrier-protein] synthase III C-terminal domain-containing protein [Paenibacillus sp.]
MLHATIAAIGTAVPDYRVPQADVKEAVRHMFGASVPQLDRLLPIFENSGIDARHFCMPLEWFLVPHDAEEKHRLFVQHAATLAERAARRCLERAGVAPTEVDHILFVTTTGTATPSIDARLFNRLGLRPNVKRTPIWGLGCAGGAAGLSRAAEYVSAFPRHRCLLVAAELCSLTFIRDDASKSNLIATSLFADGAAAALVEGEAAADARSSGGRAVPGIVSTRSTIWPDSLDVMGWDVTNDGLKVVFSKDIPSLVTREMRGVTEALLSPAGLTIPDLAHYALHPGGTKVLRAYGEALGLPSERLAAAEGVLRRYGNMSSCTVLFVLEALLGEADALRSGEFGIAGALGPGFSSELLLLRF